MSYMDLLHAKWCIFYVFVFILMIISYTKNFHFLEEVFPCSEYYKHSIRGWVSFCLNYCISADQVALISKIISSVLLVLVSFVLLLTITPTYIDRGSGPQNITDCENFTLWVLPFHSSSRSCWDLAFQIKWKFTCIFGPQSYPSFP